VAEPTEVGPAGEDTGDAGPSGSYEPLAGRGGSWIAWPGGGTYSEGSISVSNPVVLRATFSLTSVVGGYAMLERANGTQVGARVDISGIRGDKSLSWVMSSLETGMYRIRAVTGAGMGTTTYSPYFTLYEQLLPPRFTTQPQNREIALGQTAVITANAAIDAAPVATVQGQVSSDGGLTWRNEGGPQSAVLASIAVTGSATNNGWKYRFVATRASSDAYVRSASVTSDVATLTVIPAPVVTTDPVDVTVTEGARPSFVAAATGYDSVRWETRSSSTGLWSTVAGATGTTYAWPAGATLAQDGTQVRAVFTNVSGSTVTNPATLAVNPVAPAITSHPQNRTVSEGEPASFTAGYTGSGVSVRWETRAGAAGSWFTVAGATGTTYTVPSTTSAMSGSQYRAVFTNVTDSVTTNAATLTVDVAPPVITSHPIDQVVDEGGSAVFTAAATSSAAVTWRWEQRASVSGFVWRTIDGATSDTYTVDAATYAMNRWEYRAVATSVEGSAATDPARLTVNPALPRVTSHPADLRVPEGGSATFAVAYEGTEAPVSWQWQSRSGASANWAAVPGATTSTYTIRGATLLQSGSQYRVVLTNDAGSVQTNVATLTVDPVAPTVTGHPQDVTVTEGELASFSAAYGGTGASVAVQWESRSSSSGSWAAIAGATSLTYTVDATTLAMDGRSYRAVFANSAGSQESGAALLSVTPAIPHVTEHPQDQAVSEGSPATFSAAYGGTQSVVSVQWYRMGSAGSWAAIEGATSLTYTVEGATRSMNGDRFRAEFRNTAGSVTTTAGMLRVDPVTPTVAEHPRDVSVLEGGSATFSAAYAGTEYPTDTTWQYSDDDGATFAAVPPGVGAVEGGGLSVGPVDMDMQGWLFRAGFSNAAGEAWSDAARLTVLRVQPVRLTVTPRTVLVDALPGRG